MPPPIQTSTSWIPDEIITAIPVLRQVNTGPGGMYSRFEDAGLTISFEDMVTRRVIGGDRQQLIYRYK